MEFGWFLYFQDRGVPVTQMFDEHLAEVELAEELGYDEIWLAEHHFSEYGMLPSPNLILANLGARTQRLRLGNMVSVLPFYDPMRLAEEIAMLDHLTHGRLNVGIGSGVRPDEFVRYRIPLSEAKPRFYEALDVIQTALTQERFDYDGQYYHYSDAVLKPPPLQQPHPPFYVAANSPDSVRWCAERGLPIAQMYVPRAHVRDSVAAYRATTRAPASPLARPSVRVFRAVYVAETTEQAVAEAQPEMFRYFKLMSRSDDPHYREESPESWRHHVSKILPLLGPRTAEELDAEDVTIFGDPARVRQKLRRLVDEAGPDAFVGLFAFGHLSHEQVCRSVRLFAEEVMPAFRGAPAKLSA